MMDQVEINLESDINLEAGAPIPENNYQSAQPLGRSDMIKDRGEDGIPAANPSGLSGTI